MNILFLLILFIHSIFAFRTWEDEDCERHGMSIHCSSLVRGIKHTVASLDPLYVSYIDGSLPDLRYQLSNAKFMGLKSCDVKIINVNRQNKTMQFNLECPYVQTHADYTIIGYINNTFVEGTDRLRASGDGYNLLFYFNYEEQTCLLKNYIQLTDYSLDVNVTRRVNYDFRNLYYGRDEEKACEINNYLNDNWKIMDKELRAPTLYTFLDVFKKKLNNYLKVVAFKRLFSEKIFVKY